jgi:hypothetical protein
VKKKTIEKDTQDPIIMQVKDSLMNRLSKVTFPVFHLNLVDGRSHEDTKTGKKNSNSTNTYV